jgi:flagellar biosynthetic protein FliR
LSFSDAQFSAWLAAFLWPLIRIAAIFSSAPILSSRQFPVRFRVPLALFITMIIVPTLPQPPVVNVFSYDAFLIMLQQILIGVSMGFVLQMVFGALVFGGQIIAYSMGLGFASMIDPQNGTQVPVISQYYVILATLMFLLLDGHLTLIEMAVDSFHILPVATDGISRNGYYELVAWGSQLFINGLLMALPIVGVLLLVNLGMGVVMRAAPQLNIFAIGFPITIVMGLMVMAITLPNMMALFTDMLNDSFQMIRNSLLIVR